MKKVLSAAIPILMLAAFIFIMNSSFLFLRPGRYSVPTQVESIRQSVLGGNWDAVEQQLGEMDGILNKKVFPYIQFSAEMDELLNIDLSISKIKGCIASESSEMALVYLRELIHHWENLSR